MTFSVPTVSRLALLLTLLLFPRLGFATPRSLSFEPLPGTEPRASLRLLQEPGAEPVSASESQRLPGFLRILGEMGMGALMAFAGGIVGVLPPLPSCTGTLFEGCETQLFIGSAVGVTVGTALGVYLGGRLLDGNGAFLKGALPGAAVGLVAAALLGFLPRVGIEGMLLLTYPLGLIGAIVGYELTDHAVPQRSIQPMMGFSSRGASLGLSGTF